MDEALTFCVHRGSGFIKDKDRRVSQDSTCQRDSLLLTT